MGRLRYGFIQIVAESLIFLVALSARSHNPRVQEHERALNSIAAYIQQHPDTIEGMQLRKFVWSLYDAQYLINLKRFYSRLPPSMQDQVLTINTAAARGLLEQNNLYRALLVSGEFRRWEFARASDESISQLADAEERIALLARVVPPGRGYQELAHLLHEVKDVKRKLLIELQKLPATAEIDPDEGCPF